MCGPRHLPNLVDTILYSRVGQFLSLTFSRFCCTSVVALQVSLSEKKILCKAVKGLFTSSKFDLRNRRTLFKKSVKLFKKLLFKKMCLGPLTKNIKLFHLKVPELGDKEKRQLKSELEIRVCIIMYTKRLF